MLRKDLMYKLYQITNTVNGKSYIGITKLSILERWNCHLSNSRRPRYPLYYAIAKYGAQSFTVTLLEENEDRKYISELEEPTIRRLNTHITSHGYNVAKGGYGGDMGPESNAKRIETIKNWSPERVAVNKERLRLRNLGKTKETDTGRMSQSEKIKGNSFRKGIPHSPEDKDKISLGNKGKVRSQEAIQNYKKAAIIRGIGPQLQGKKVGCMCCHKEWDLGNYTQHITRNSK
jgi:group I intron endonuclease